MELFPVEVTRAPYETLLRIPGIGVRSAQRIRAARRVGSLTFDDLGRMGAVLKRARYFIACGGKVMPGLKITPEGAYQALVGGRDPRWEDRGEQTSLYDPPALTREDVMKCLTGQL